MPAERADRFGSPWMLVGALGWRARREGLRYLLVTFIPFLFMLAALIVPSLLSKTSVNGGATFAAFATHYGAQAGTVTVGLALLLEPGAVALFAAISVATLVRNLIGSEASRGGIEALLAGPYRPMSIMVALVGYVGALATLYWAGMTAIAAVTLSIVVWASAATLSLPASYLMAVLVLPLLAAWASTGLSLLATLLYPRLAQAGSSRALCRCTITGWLAGRPLTAKMRRTAAGLRASAPSPYTVSVGKATNAPARSAPRAAARSAGAMGPT